MWPFRHETRLADIDAKMDELGRSAIDADGVRRAEQFNEVLTPHSHTERVELIGRLYSREDGRWLAEVLMDLEVDEGEPARLLLAESTSRPSSCSALTTPRGTTNASTSCMSTSNERSIEPWSCHCQLVSIAGAQQPSHGTGSGSSTPRGPRATRVSSTMLRPWTSPPPCRAWGSPNAPNRRSDSPT